MVYKKTLRHKYLEWKLSRVENKIKLLDMFYRVERFFI